MTDGGGDKDLAVHEAFAATVDPVEYRGERVITLRTMEELHQRPAGTAGRNFRRHRGKGRLVEGKHFFEVPAAEIPEVATKFVGTSTTLILLTEAGYLMLVKCFRDDLAWKVQEYLVEHYFRSRDLRPSGSFDPAEFALSLRDGLLSGLLPVVQQQTERIRSVERRVEGVEDCLRQDVVPAITAMQRKLFRRTVIKERDKRDHVAVVELAFGGRCPACGLVTIAKDGEKVQGAEFDHFYSPNQSEFKRTWLVCMSCNRGFATPDGRTPAVADSFRVYQNRAERVLYANRPRQLELFVEDCAS